MTKYVWVLVLSLLILLAAIIALDFRDTREHALALADAELARRAQHAAADVDRVLEWRTIETLTFVALPSFRGFAASDETARPARTAIALAELQAIVAADPSIRSAAIVNSAGQVVLATDSTINDFWGTRVFVKEALEGHLHASVPVGEFGEISQYYSGPLVDNGGQVAGALVMRVAVQELWKSISDIPNVSIVNADHVRIADTSDRAQIFTSLVPMDGDALAEIAEQQLYGSEVRQIRVASAPDLAHAIDRGEKRSVFLDADGKVYHAALARTKNNPWTVVAIESEDEISRPAWQAILTHVKVAFIAVVSAAVVVFGYMRWSSAREPRS